MKQDGRKARSGGEVLTVDKQGLRQIFDKEAQKRLRLSGQEALERIQTGQAGDNYIWSDLSILASMLR